MKGIAIFATRNTKAISILCLTFILALGLALAPQPAKATFVSLQKEHTPSPSTFKDPSGTIDGFHRGDTVTFTITANILIVQGGAAISIMKVTVDDVLPAGLTYVPGSQTNAVNNSAQMGTATFTQSGQNLSWNFTSTFTGAHLTIAPQVIVKFQATVDSNVPDSTYLVNSADMHYTETITGTASNPSVTDTIYVAFPILSIFKTNPAKVENGTSFDNVITLNNTGEQDATGVVVTDNIPSGTTHVAGTATASSGTITTDTASQVVWTGTVGNVTGTHIVTITIPVTANTAATSVTDTATITSAPSYAVVSPSSASCTTKVLHPKIALTKTPSAPKIENNTSVTYTYNVTNIGDTALSAVNITDNLYDVIASGESLSVGQSKIFTHTATLTANTTNTATAFGIDQFGVKVNATATATVQVIHPKIALTKTPSASKIENNTSVTYTYNVTNTGDTALTVGITDDKFGTITSGQSLAVGQSKQFTHTATLTANTTNVATATGVDQTGASVQAQATATVQVIHPKIGLTKTPSLSKVEVNTTVSYTYNVTNKGDVALTGNVTDDVFSLVGTFTNMPPGGWVAFTVSHIITANTTNTATATGIDQLGTKVQATATATVRVIHPKIALTKTPSPNTPQVAPATFTYTYVVTNIGDVTLYNVTVYDETFNVKILGPIASLAVSASQSGTYSKTYTAPGTYINYANATGFDQLGVKVKAVANATVVVTPPTLFPKQFTSSYGFGGYAAPVIIDGGLNSTVVGLGSGPRIAWDVTYYFANTAEYLGSQFDNKTHYFRLWDKWGGNLMALPSQPVAFNASRASNVVTLANGDTFKIDVTGYKAYVDDGIDISSLASQGNAYIYLFVDSQQTGTNPGANSAKSNPSDGKSYDTSIVWEIGSLAPGESATLKVYIAPGKNPAGNLLFSSTGFTKINTGPRVRVYSDAEFTDFLYAIDKTVQLGVIVTK